MEFEPIEGRTSADLQFEYDINEPREVFIKKMEERGCKAVIPGAKELQIDIDSERQYEQFKEGLSCLERNWQVFGPVSVEEHLSMSGLPCRHITLTLPVEVTAWQRIALQAALGSDPLRELLSATRLMKGDVHPTLFIELA